VPARVEPAQVALGEVVGRAVQRRGDDALALAREEGAQPMEVREREEREALAPGEQVGLVADVLQRRALDRAVGQHHAHPERQPDGEDDDEPNREKEPHAQ